MHQPLVSVVMCTFNGAEFIDEQIKSIVEQSYQHIEILIADDNSVDDTWQKLESWQQKDSRIQLFKNETNIGYNKNFENIISKANGEFIAIADQDDIWQPQKIKKLLHSFTNENFLLSHNRSVRLENGRLRFKSASLHHHFKGSDTKRLFMYNQINGHDMIFRKTLVAKVFPLPAGMMYDWWIAVLATCLGSIASVDEFLVYHRIHHQNSFFNKDKNKIEKQLDLEEVLHLFQKIPEMKYADKKFLDEFLFTLTRHHTYKNKFDISFFLFLLKNGKIFFGHKKRWIPQFNYIKMAFKYAHFNFKGKGITF